MSDQLKDVPEFFEVDLGESLISRTETLASFRELGPPDLCHIIKTAGKSSTRDIGSYHYVSGLDASSSASLAAYVNSLTYSLDSNQAGWGFGGGATKHKIRSGAYCCFNAFSRVDLRVEVKIPGGVDSYVVDLRGERHPATPLLWQETYLSALLRAILYADDANYRLAGFRKLDPIPTPEAEHRFLQAAENAFFKGWQLGSDPEIQVATTVSNHLTAGILKYFGDSFRWGPAANLFEKLVVKEAEVASLLAKSYIGMNEEVKAVQILHRAMQTHSQSYSLLHVQCDFLRSKGKMEWALVMAKQAVNCAPSEFVTWAKLTEVHIEMGNFYEALLTLNSCPMFTYNDRDLHRMPTPLRTHLPVKPFIAESGILDEDSASNNEADITLLRLPAPSLRGTFAKAYALLAKLAGGIGWDELLKCRSAVFVMEEEYRLQKSKQEGGPSSANNDDRIDNELDGKSLDSGGDNIPNGRTQEGQPYDINHPSRANGDNASTVALHSASAKPSVEHQVADEGASTMARKPLSRTASGQSIPTIKISRGSEEAKRVGENGVSEEKKGNGEEEKVDGETEEGGEEKKVAGEDGVEEIESKTTSEGEGGGEDISTEDNKSPGMTGDAPGVAKPNAAAQEPGKENNLGIEHFDEHAAKATGTAGPAESEANGPTASEGTSFSNKRLCERWLDNLFMVLYEDLRVYTIWRAEVAHYKAQHMQYKKTGTEWEILGDLAQRLQHKEEAKDAYQRCLEHKFSAKSWLKLLEYYADEGDVGRALNAAVRLSTYQHRWYMETSYPTAVAHQLYKVIRENGLSKISFSLVSMNFPQDIMKNVMQGYFQYGQVFRIEGSDI